MINDVVFTGTNSGIAVGQSGTILRTTDGGTNANIGTVVGGYPDPGTILRTTNGGTSWERLTSRTSNTLNAVFFSDANTGTVVGDRGTIMRTTTGGVSSVDNVNSTDAHPIALEQNYPNPANATTTIGFTIESAGTVLIDVFDALNNRIAVVVDEAMQQGRYHATFDVQNLPSGVYYYRIHTADAVAAKRLVVVR